MKKYIISFLLAGIFLAGTPFISPKANAADLSIRDFINLLILLEVIPANKVAAVNAYLNSLDDSDADEDIDIGIDDDDNDVSGGKPVVRVDKSSLVYDSNAGMITADFLVSVKSSDSNKAVTIDNFNTSMFNSSNRPIYTGYGHASIIPSTNVTVRNDNGFQYYLIPAGKVGIFTIVHTESASRLASDSYYAGLIDTTLVLGSGSGRYTFPNGPIGKTNRVNVNGGIVVIDPVVRANVNLVSTPNGTSANSFNYTVSSNQKFDQVIFRASCNNSEIEISAKGGMDCEVDNIIPLRSHFSQYSYPVSFVSRDGNSHTVGMMVTLLMDGIKLGSDKDAITVRPEAKQEISVFWNTSSSNPDSGVYSDPRLLIDNVDSVPRADSASAKQWCNLVPNKGYTNGSVTSSGAPYGDRVYWDNGEKWEKISNSGYSRVFSCTK